MVLQEDSSKSRYKWGWKGRPELAGRVSLDLMKGQATPILTEEVHMETLALVLAILFVGEIIDLRREPNPTTPTLVLVALLFGGALALGIYLAVTA